jgi:hypothetical protein
MCVMTHAENETCLDWLRGWVMSIDRHSVVGRVRTWRRCVLLPPATIEYASKVRGDNSVRAMLMRIGQTDS